MANKSTLISRRNYGMKIAMPGFDARTAGDNELLFNSSFPILQIKVLASLGSNSADVRDLPNGGEYCGENNGFHLCRWYHGLGFVPFFIVLDKQGSQNTTSYGVDDQFIYLQRQNIRRNDEKVLVCPIDITRDIEYPYTAKPIQVDDYTRNQVGNYGFKSIEHGAIEDNDFNNYGINVRLQSQMVLAIKTEETVINKPSGPHKQYSVEYVLPRNMIVDDCMSYVMFKTKIIGTNLDVWSHGSQYLQGSPAIKINRSENKASVITTTDIPVSLIITRLPMVAAHKTESVF